LEFAHPAIMTEKPKAYHPALWQEKRAENPY